jgi:cephalosporin hydroxylase
LSQALCFSTTADPFLQEIVFDVAPDLIIEMGTNSGGSSLYYAFLLEAVNPEGKIVTVDVEPVEKWSRRWHERRSAVDSPYWKKRVTQLLGYSTSASVQQQVTAMAERVRARGGKVLVVLDGCHDYACVKEELSVYAPLVTVGSYCVVEDTSRWKFYDGAGRAAREFSAAHQGTWKVDKTREYLYYSEHHDGFLKRLV